MAKKRDASGVRNDVDSYTDTVRAIVAFVHELRWDDKARRLRDDAIHRHGAPHERPGGDPVTPDVSLRLGKQAHTLGDVKMSFASGGPARRGIEEQLAKYDEVATALLAAPNPPAETGSVLLTHYTRKVDAEDHFKASKWTPKQPFAVVAFNRHDQGEQWITLERSYGSLVPSAKDDKFRRIVKIAFRHITVYEGVKFYDASPPLAHLLSVLWDIILSERLQEESFAQLADRSTRVEDDDDADAAGAPAKTDPAAASAELPAPQQAARTAEKGRSSMPITITAPDVAKRLQESCSLKALDPSLPGAPSLKSVRAALDQLVQLSLAKRGASEDEFLVSYKRLRPNTLDWFAKRLAPKPPPKVRARAPKKRGRSNPGQLKLFGDRG